MTVAELIDELNKVEDKELQVYYVDNEYGEQTIAEVLYVKKNVHHSYDKVNPHYILQWPSPNT